MKRPTEIKKDSDKLVRSRNVWRDSSRCVRAELLGSHAWLKLNAELWRNLEVCRKDYELAPPTLNQITHLKQLLKGMEMMKICILLL